MRSGSSQVHVVMRISVMKNQEIDAITFFIIEENPKPVISEKKQRTL